MPAVQAPPRAAEAKVRQFIVFEVSQEEFGIPIGEVREIIKAGRITPIPDSPRHIKGLINVRGDIVTTVDLRARFGLAQADAARGKHIVITRQADNLFGLMVDEVREVLRISEAEIRRSPGVTRGVDDDYVTGVIATDNRLIILLDLGQLLSAEDLARPVAPVRRPDVPDNEPAAEADEGEAP